MRPYEMMIILAPDVPEEELDPSIDTIESYITREDGNVIVINRESPWGRRRLAYPIRHAGRDVRDGFYTLWYFDAEPTAITEIERELRLNDRIIRHMIIALDEQVTLLPIEPEVASTEGTADGESTGAAPVEASTEETPATEDVPAAEAPAAEATADEAPDAEAAADEAPADEAPAADVPAAVAESAPAEDAPAAATDEQTSEE